MSFIHTVDASTAPADVREMYAHQQKHWGYIPDYAKLFSHRPESLKRWGRLLSELRRFSDDRRFELVTFVVALEVRNSGCSLVHGVQLAKLIGKERVIAIANRNEHMAMCMTDQAIIRFTRKLALDATTISYEDIDTLRAEYGLTDAEIFDITAIAAGRCFFTKILDGLGCQPDAQFEKIDQDLRNALTVGRAISDESGEVLAELAGCESSTQMESDK